MAEDAIAVGARTLWFQLGLRHDAAAQRAHDAGLNVVADRCLKIEHARFHGGLHLAGFDTGVITSRRRDRLDRRAAGAPGRDGGPGRRRGPRQAPPQQLVELGDLPRAALDLRPVAAVVRAVPTMS